MKEDDRELSGLGRQLLIRLLDETIIDDTLADLISAVMYYFPSVQGVPMDEARRHQLFHGSTRALERQICRGTLQNQDQIRYSHMAAEFCAILQ